MPTTSEDEDQKLVTTLRRNLRTCSDPELRRKITGQIERIVELARNKRRGATKWDRIGKL